MKLDKANSTEMDPETPHPVIDLMEHQKDITHKGGTMRLGAYDCRLKPDSLSKSIYNTKDIRERHRHRYEFNNEYMAHFIESGMVPAGINPDSGLVEIMEIPEHKWFIGVQFHPEYKSTVSNPHPLFVSFIKASMK